MIDYTIDHERRLTVCRASGRLPFLEVARAMQHMLENAAKLSDFNGLFVIADSGAFLSCSDLRALRPLVQAGSEKHCTTHWAIVLPDTAARVMADLVLRELRLSVASFACFVNEAEAIEWLESNEPAVNSSRLEDASALGQR